MASRETDVELFPLNFFFLSNVFARLFVPQCSEKQGQILRPVICRAERHTEAVSVPLAAARDLAHTLIIRPRFFAVNDDGGSVSGNNSWLTGQDM